MALLGQVPDRRTEEEYAVGMTECCATCANRYDLERLDYSRGGCQHEKLGGYICMVFAGEGTAMWMVGANPEAEMCEGYDARGDDDGRI